jgi:cell division protein FtsB
MTEREEKELKAENQVLRNNVKDLERQLHDAYKRISELNESTISRQ